MYKVLVLDPDGLLRAAIVSLLGSLGFGQVVEVANIVDLARYQQNESAPKLLLVRLSREDETASAIIAQAATLFPETKIVFLAHDLDMETMISCFAAGAFGYLLDNISREALGASLALVNDGGKVFPAELAAWLPNLTSRSTNFANIPANLNLPELSERETDILRCLALGKSNKGIAQSLNIAEATVKLHVKRVLRKVHASNRTQAALWAAARGLSQMTESPHAANQKRMPHKAVGG